MSINDAKLYAIEKTTKWSKTLQNFEHIWIFSDSQTAIQCIENCTHFLANEIHKTTENSNSAIHIHWILDHADISKNEKANQLAKSVFSSSTITRDRFLSFKFLNDQITKHNRRKWLNSWKLNSKKEKLYEKFDTILEDLKI
jgi:ribonuclease HI